MNKKLKSILILPVIMVLSAGVAFACGASGSMSSLDTDKEKTISQDSGQVEKEKIVLNSDEK
jgi:hypothetical protein